MLAKTEAATGRKTRRGRSGLRLFLVIVTLFTAIHVMAPGRAGSAQALTNAEEEPEISSRTFWATAYCTEGITKSGIPAAPGIVAADTAVLPLGSVICVEGSEYEGFYQVMDTGRLVRGKKIDIFIPSLDRALEFGRRRVQVTVLRYGFYR